MSEPSVGGLQVEVLSMPSWEGGLASDLHRAKSGLLYGDGVSISSVPLATVYYAARIAHGALSDRDVLEEGLDSAQMLDDSAFEPEGRAATVDSIRALIARLDQAERTGDAATLSEIRQITDSMRAMQRDEVSETPALRAAIEIADADERGLVTVRRMTGVSGATAEEVILAGIRWWQSEIGRALDNPRAVIFADDAAMAILSAGNGVAIDGGPASERAKASQLASALFQRLPLLPYASLDELAEVRQRLDSPLRRFRAEMLRVGGELQSEPFSDDLVTEIDNYIVELVEPSILEIEDAFNGNVFLRSLVERSRSVAGKYLAPGSALGVAIVSGNAASALAVGGLAAMGLAGAAGLDALRAQSTARTSGLFFYQRLTTDYGV